MDTENYAKQELLVSKNTDWQAETKILLWQCSAIMLIFFPWENHTTPEVSGLGAFIVITNSYLENLK